MKLAKIALFCMLLASTKAILADDVYRCGSTYQDAPCASGNSRPINEKPIRASVSQHTLKAANSNGNKSHTKKVVSKRKLIAPEPTEIATEAEITQNATSITNKTSNTTISSPTAAAQAVMAPTTNALSAKVVDKPIEAQPTLKTAEKDITDDEQGICSSLKAGLENISMQKHKAGNAVTIRDLNQQQKNLESAKQSAGC